MASPKLHFVIGVRDPEAVEIARIILAKRAGRITYAKYKGQPVNPGTAYEADSIQDGADDEVIILIECRPRELRSGARVKLIDHHHSGDPGWDAPPVEYWRGSSLGQLMELLHLPANRYQRALAAMDHCFAAAMRGECPGVSPKVVLQVKINEIAKHHGVPAWKVRRLIRRHRRQLSLCRTVLIGTQRVLDYRTVSLGEGYSLDLLTTQVAATLLDRAALLRHKDPGGREKVTLTGSVPPSTVEAFCHRWANENGLVECYGSPKRGYSGGYLK